MNQNNAFLEGEADRYYQRNAEANARYSVHEDVVAQMILEAGICPVSIADMGCSSGERLSALCRRYAAHGLGVDASSDAIDSARARDAYVDWHVADWAAYDDPTSFDVIITSYVWHWVDRDDLLAAMARTDRLLVPGGYLVINDFGTVADVPYKHSPGLMTYKRHYPSMFLATGLYELEDSRRYPYQGVGEPCECALLRRLA